jgi:hypothetical protein
MPTNIATRIAKAYMLRLLWVLIELDQRGSWLALYAQSPHFVRRFSDFRMGLPMSMFDARRLFRRIGEVLRDDSQ